MNEILESCPFEEPTGKYEIKQGKKGLTNEQWFCQLPTVEKSEFLSEMVKEAIEVYEKHGTTWHEAVSWWDCWLKEKHE